MENVTNIMDAITGPVVALAAIIILVIKSYIKDRK